MLGAVAWDFSLLSPTGAEVLPKWACFRVLLPTFSEAKAVLAS